MHFFKFSLRDCLFCVLALQVVTALTVNFAFAAESEKPDSAPAMDKSGAAKMFLRGGELEAERSDWEAAVAKFHEALKLEENNAMAHYDLGVAQFHLGQLELASQAEKRAISLDPKMLDAYIQLASIYSRLGDYSGAEDILERALKVDEHCKIARDSLNEICRLKKSHPAMFEKRVDSSSEPAVPREKLKHSS